MIKLYIAILNRGWIRREISSDLLPAMYSMDGVKVTWENPKKTWDHPISSNRNRIVKRFLKTDNDFLMMIDDDIVPLSNPAKYVFADKDVIGFPAKVRQGDRQLNWVAYVLRPDRHEYAPVDFTKVDSSIGLLKVDAVGTGCILIKRNVLESIKAPFHIHFDDDGVLTMGTDFSFCERASDAGFEVYTAPRCVCEHIKELGMLDFGSYNDCDGVDTAAIKYDIPWGGMAINPGDWEFIKKIIIDEKPKKILEFGSGLSSLLMSEYANVDAWEFNSEWAKIVRKKSLNGHLNVHDWCSNPEIDVSKYDLAFIDGPIGKINGGPGREESFKIASNIDSVVVHDAGRDEEVRLQDKYLKDFKLVDKNGWHQSRCAYWKKQ